MHIPHYKYKQTTITINGRSAAENRANKLTKQKKSHIRITKQ